MGFFKLGPVSILHTRVFVLLALAMLSACASPAEMNNMIVNQRALVSSVPDTPFIGAITINRVTGGEQTNPLWTSQIDNVAFTGALERSLENSGLLAPGLPKARFSLDATLSAVNQPLFGLDMTVASRVNYHLKEIQTNKIWFDDSISASHTATFSDSAIGIQRLRFANEGSIRENISVFIKRLLERKSSLN